MWAGKPTERPLRELVRAWDDEPILPLSQRVTQALARVQAAGAYSEDVLCGYGSEVPTEALDTLRELTERADERSDEWIYVLMKVLRNLTVSRPQFQSYLLDSGIVDAVLLLSGKGPRSFAAASIVLWNFFNQSDIANVKAVFQRAEDKHVDIVQTVVECLSTQSCKQDTLNVLQLTEALIGTLVNVVDPPPVDSLRRLLRAVIQITQVSEREDIEFHTVQESQMLLWRICCKHGWRQQELGQVLLDVDMFQHMCRPGWLSFEMMYKIEVGSVVARITEMSTEIQHSFLQSGILMLLEEWLSCGDMGIALAYSVLTEILHHCDNECLDTLMSQERFCERLIFHHPYPRRLKAEVVDRALRRSRTARKKWPIVQLLLFGFFVDQVDQTELFSFMQNASMSRCIRKLRELPIPGLADCYEHPKLRYDKLNLLNK